MQINKLDQMFEVLKNAESKRLVAVWANDSHTIEAVSKAIDMNIVEGTLVGNQDEIKKVCQEENIDVNKFQIVHTETDIEASKKAVELISKGEGDILMKGLISTDKYMRAILNKEAGLFPPKAILSHVAVVENPEYHKLLIMSDAAIIPEPDLKQKTILIKYLTQTAQSLGIKKPKLAVLSASEQVLPSVQSSIDACILAKMSERGQIRGAIVDGPLSLDLAIDKETAKTKKMKGEVAGDADCLLFPNLDSGNIFYKTNSKLGNAKMAGFLVGAKVPCVLSSRGDTTEAKLHSIGLCAMLAINKS